VRENRKPSIWSVDNTLAIRLKPSWNLGFMGFPSPEKFAEVKTSAKL
jgi:hypothetical protein